MAFVPLHNRFQISMLKCANWQAFMNVINTGLNTVTPGDPTKFKQDTPYNFKRVTEHKFMANRWGNSGDSDRLFS